MISSAKGVEGIQYKAGSQQLFQDSSTCITVIQSPFVKSCLKGKYVTVNVNTKDIHFCLLKKLFDRPCSFEHFAFFSIKFISHLLKYGI